jgi:hypothetical protein
MEDRWRTRTRRDALEEIAVEDDRIWLSGLAIDRRNTRLQGMSLKENI